MVFDKHLSFGEGGLCCPVWEAVIHIVTTIIGAGRARQSGVPYVRPRPQGVGPSDPSNPRAIHSI